MLCITLAGVCIGIRKNSRYLQQICSDYISAFDSKPDFSVDVSADDIFFEKQHSEFCYTDDVYEATAIYRKICEKMLQYDCFLFHSAVIKIDGKALAFAAKSGVGKSTHISLWQQHFGNRVTIINGDKPLIRKIDGRFFAFGAPWCGKEMQQTNTSGQLSGVCFLERGATNEIELLPPEKTVLQIYNQLILPADKALAQKQMSLLNDFISSVPFYKLKCNISDEAVTTAYNAMIK